MAAQTSPAEYLDFLGSRVRVFSDGFVEHTAVPAGEMPPLHVHHEDDEGFYVLEGRVTLYMPRDEVTLGPGDFFLAPRGVPHTYRVSDDGPAGWLCTSEPARFGSFVRDVAALEEQEPAAVGEVAASYGIEILGPPGTMP
jgi:mannose-6-phosphate isomerase-like protein (cupin superfamily)